MIPQKVLEQKKNVLKNGTRGRKTFKRGGRSEKDFIGAICNNLFGWLQLGGIVGGRVGGRVRGWQRR